MTRILHGNEGDLGLFPAQPLLCATPSIGLPSKLGENNAVLPATNFVKIKSATCQRSAHLLLDESCANSSVDRKKIFNFISAFGLASFPVTLMTPESQWRNAFPLLRV